MSKEIIGQYETLLKGLGMTQETLDFYFSESVDLNDYGRNLQFAWTVFHK